MRDWKVAIGIWKVAIGRWLLADGIWNMASGGWRAVRRGWGQVVSKRGDTVQKWGVKNVYDVPQYPHIYIHRVLKQIVIPLPHGTIHQLSHHLYTRLPTVIFTNYHLLIRHLSALSTQPITTTTTYILIEEEQS